MIQSREIKRGVQALLIGTGYIAFYFYECGLVGHFIGFRTFFGISANGRYDEVNVLVYRDQSL